MAKEKFVYMFTETDETMKDLVGGKGANLGQMTKLGLPIPQGFTVTTDACKEFYENESILNALVVKEIDDSLRKLEKITGKIFGDPSNPLLVSVRSGARVSMPGMMDTILNLGLNDVVVEGLAKITNNPRFAYDSYRRFIQMYSDVVMGLSKKKFEDIIDEMKDERNIVLDTEFSAADFQVMIKKFKKLYFQTVNDEFPVDPKVQLLGAISAVFESWENPRADYYRMMNNIPFEWGTAVNVQAMVYGNMGDTSGTGVVFTRNPATGEDKIFGEYLINAQGEDVVAGTRTPSPISDLQKMMPKVYDEFVELCERLEKHFKDMQDIEFTIEDSKLYLLQTRGGKRTAQAALKIAVDLVDEGLTDKRGAILLVQPEQLDTLLHPHFDQAVLKEKKHIGEGLPASPGAATGQIAFTVDQVTELAKRHRKAVLVRLETSPEDIEGMHVAEGFLTARGGMTSHAAVVARGMGKCCIASCKNMIVDEKKGIVTINGRVLKQGDWISIDGTTGRVYDEELPTTPATMSGDFKRFMDWTDEFKTLEIRTNADTPDDAKQARDFGAVGIGLCRTEHMFFGAERIRIMRQMILASSREARQEALDKLLPIQRADFEALFETMDPYPVTIRYLDPPLHEFLPTTPETIRDLAEDLGVTTELIRNRAFELHEVNPMMGHRGCRLAISYPELPEMQTRAVIEAYINVKRRNPKYKAIPEIMIPLVGDEKEYVFLKNIVVATADSILKEHKTKLEYKVGTMIEVPRACMRADKIAEISDFFSFGTNDLTQMTYGFSRDDAATFLSDYYETRVFEQDPFARLDQDGVGELVRMAVDKGRSAKPGLKLGICGEHGGDPSSIEFFNRVGLDYVSCSPFRVPIARLAAAHAAIKLNK